MNEAKKALDGRGERIRTSDPLVPNQVLYQAEPLPDRPTCCRWDARRHRPGRDGRLLERTYVSVAEWLPLPRLASAFESR